MKKVLASTFGAVLALSAVAANAAPLDALKWDKRVLILFDQSRSSASLDRQIDRLRERRPDVDERDMIVLVSAGNERAAIAMGYARLPNGIERTLRRFYKPAERGMTMILLGKDGSEKQRWNRTIDPQEIFDVIDSMPMRQREMSEEET
ncbi:DUF4174 domain-containing protein [Pseudahrensia aquimaris]|uniref:DUF4174 domain-containing protein n=1 Tax=Pseudahrensia aquimaris TaxID=744461 RepID=A0ABW3FG71_9HYPH